MAVEGGMKCVKFLVFIFNFIFWVSAGPGGTGRGAGGDAHPPGEPGRGLRGRQNRADGPFPAVAPPGDGPAPALWQAAALPRVALPPSASSPPPYGPFDTPFPTLAGLQLGVMGTPGGGPCCPGGAAAGAGGGHSWGCRGGHRG